MTKRICERVGPADLRQLHREHPSRYPFLLQSTTPGGELGRYDILFAFPGEALVAKPGETFLDSLDKRWLTEKVYASESDLPFTGGWFLYLGYELAQQIEPGLDLERDPILPAAFAVRCPTALVYDHEEAFCHLVCETHECVNEAQLDADISALEQAGDAAIATVVSVQEQEPTDFTEAVIKAKAHIEAGDIYQANLSREWRAEVTAGLDASDIYEALCTSNPGPFAGMARWEDIEIISSSPERAHVPPIAPLTTTYPRNCSLIQRSALSTSCSLISSATTWGGFVKPAQSRSMK